MTLGLVEIGSQPLGGFDTVLSTSAAQALHLAERLSSYELGGRRIWNVNSTARGGGVAEMLRPLLAYAPRGRHRRPLGRGRGRRAVLRRDQPHPQPAARDAGRRWPLGRGRAQGLRGRPRAERRGAPLAGRAGRHRGGARSADGGAHPARAHAASRSSGAATSGSTCRTSLRWRLGGSSSRMCCAPTRTCLARGVRGGRTRPGQARDHRAVDRRFAPKNAELSPAAVDAILVAAGLRAGRAGAAFFTRMDGSTGRVRRTAKLLKTAPLGAYDRFVAQVSR